MQSRKLAKLGLSADRISISTFSILILTDP